MNQSSSNFGLKKFTWVFALLAIFGTIGMGTVHAQQAPRVIKIGCLFHLTGPGAAYGVENEQEVAVIEELINEMGGVRALGGAKFKFICADTQTKPTVAASEAERLIEQEKVVAIIGMPPSFIILSGSAVAERLKTPYVNPVAFADQLCRRGFKYFFEVQPTAHYIVQTQVSFLDFFNKAYNMNIKKVGIIHEDTDYGKSLSSAQRTLLSKAGYELTGDVEYNSKAPDLSSPVLKLKAADPQFVIQSSYFTDSLQIAKTANRIALRVPFLDAQGKSPRQYLKAAGSLAEGDFILVIWNMDLPIPLSKQLAKRYEEKYKNKPGQDAGALFQSALLLKKAVETVGSVDRDAIRNALQKNEILPGPDLVLPYEKIKFDETGMNTFGRPLVTQVQDGDFISVWPERYASKKIRILEGWKKP